MRHSFHAVLFYSLRRSRLSQAVAALLFAGASLQTPPIFAQANVPENYQAYLYVDANAGADTNPGTQTQPLQTLAAASNKALSNNLKSLSTKIIVNPGIYRETLRLWSQTSQTSATIAFEAAQPGAAVVSGSDVYTNWYQGTSNPAIYTHSWTYDFGPCAAPTGWPANLPAIVLRREMVFINGASLTQVLDIGQLRPGTFFVDEVANVLQIWPAPGMNPDPNAATVEVATRPSTLSITGRTNTVLRGLVLRHAASCINATGANIVSSNNALVDQVQAVWNSWGGLGLHTSSNVTVQNTIGSFNGGLGLGAFQGKNIEFQNDEADYNNWRGAQGAIYDWGMGGLKFMLIHNGTFSQLYTYRNHAQGLWFDTDNRNITVTGAVSAENELANLQVELNYGPISIQDSTFCSGTLGLNLVNSSNISLQHNTFYNNGNYYSYQGNIYLAGKAGGRSFTDWETGVYYNVISSNFTLLNNVLQNAGPNQRLFTTYQIGTDWTQFSTTFNANNNQWYDPAQPSPYTLGGGKKYNFTGWKTQTGQDLQSTWTLLPSATQSCPVPDPAVSDFSLHADNRSYTMVNGSTQVSLNLRPYMASIATLGPGGPAAAQSSLQLETSALPPGITATFAAPSPTPYGLSSTLTVTASSSALAGTIPVTIFAQSGNQVKTATVSVTVIPPPMVVRSPGIGGLPTLPGLWSGAAQP